MAGPWTGQPTARIIERALGAEMDGHLGYEERRSRAGRGTGNSRNGHYAKTLTTQAGPVRISAPRDRNAEFEPRIVKKGQRRSRLSQARAGLLARAGHQDPALRPL
jgi:putative transposase